MLIACRSAAGALGLAGVCFAFTAMARASWALVLGPGALRPADLLLALVASCGLGLAVWLAVSLVLSLVARVPGAFGSACASVADRITPAALRKAVAVLLGTSVVGAVVPGTSVAASINAPSRPSVAAAFAQPLRNLTGDDLADPPLRPTSPAADPDPALRPTSPAPAPDPGFRPPPPSSPAVTATLGPLQPPPRTSAAVSDHYVVRRGDTLWDIAAGHLGPRMSASAVAREWPRWYAVNRVVIGPDPSCIRPGQRLQPPAAPGDAR